MKIKSIKIEKLYGKYDFDWDLRSDINIIAGDNGSYKTTLLNIIASLCEPKSVPESYILEGATLVMTEDISVKFRSFRDSLLKLKKDAANDEMLTELVTKFQAEIDEKNEKNLSDLTLNASVIAIKQGESKLSVGNFKKLRIFNKISTFDVPALKNEMSSVLDQQLEVLESEYAYYLSDLSKQLSDLIHQAGKVDMEDMKKIYAHNDMFIEIVNEAFKRTNKTVDTTKSKLQFKIGDELLASNKRLSSGEKQFIIVMLTILLQRNQESILIMDEPEISMHLDWQRNLIQNIQKLNPNSQIILATHSTGIIMDGWEQLVTNISDLISVKD